MALDPTRPGRGRPDTPQAVRDLDSPARHAPAIDEWIAARLLAGASPQRVVAESNDRMTLRTAYRWKRTLTGLQEVVVGGHRATFALRRGHPPARITPWEPA